MLSFILVSYDSVEVDIGLPSRTSDLPVRSFTLADGQAYGVHVLCTV